jgi:hypothetical protein
MPYYHSGGVHLNIRRRTLPMNVPSRLTFYSAEYALDGGSTRLYAWDEHGAEHRVYLPRDFYSDGSSVPRQRTGLLYFDDERIPVRSALESDLLRLFREAMLAPRSVLRPGEMKLTPPFTVVGKDLEQLVRGTEEENLRFLVDSVITYVESDAYGSAGTAQQI